MTNRRHQTKHSKHPADLSTEEALSRLEILIESQAQSSPLRSGFQVKEQEQAETASSKLDAHNIHRNQVGKLRQSAGIFD